MKDRHKKEKNPHESITGFSGGSLSFLWPELE